MIGRNQSSTRLSHEPKTKVPGEVQVDPAMAGQSRPGGWVRPTLAPDFFRQQGRWPARSDRDAFASMLWPAGGHPWSGCRPARIHQVGASVAIEEPSPLVHFRGTFPISLADPRGPPVTAGGCRSVGQCHETLDDLHEVATGNVRRVERRGRRPRGRTPRSGEHCSARRRACPRCVDRDHCQLPGLEAEHRRRVPVRGGRGRPLSHAVDARHATHDSLRARRPAAAAWWAIR